MPDKTQETPRGARFSVNLTVDCYPSVSPSGEAYQSANLEGLVQDISSGGACIITSFPLKNSEVLKISFPIQSSISSFISTPRTLAEVRWTKPANKDKFIAGLRFLL